ncbi:MAG: LCP family protein [Clostridia bacterium]|nr:LCP family protein [Clostridia bacterium]
MRRARTKESKAKKRLTVFLVSFLAVCTVFVLMLGFHGVLFPMSGIIDGDYVMPVDKATGKANVLLLGVDEDGLRTDTIIVASYDLDNSKINMLSVPRDTRMYIGKNWQKINGAYSLSKNGKKKGAQGTIEAVSRLTGIPINYYVEFSCEAFRNTIDALGGVEFNVPQRMYYQDPVQDLDINLQPGLQLLDGDKAEQLIRFRKYPGGDIDRVNMQQQFIKALAEQKLNIGIIKKLDDIYTSLKNDIKTNVTVGDVIKYIPNLKELTSEDITMYQLPGDFSGPEYTASYWLADMTELKSLIETVFGYDATNIMTGVKGKTDPGGDRAKQASSSKAEDKVQKSPKPTSTPKPNGTPKPDDEDNITIPDKKEDKSLKGNENDKAEAVSTPKPTAKPTPVPQTDVIQLD